MNWLISGCGWEVVVEADSPEIAEALLIDQNPWLDVSRMRTRRAYVVLH